MSMEQQEIPASEDPEWREWRATLMQAWIDTRMEADRSILTLSSGGVALLVTLLTTVGVQSVWTGVFYVLGLVAFLVAIAAALRIYRLNAEHLVESVENPEKAHNSKTRKRMGMLDRWLWWAFWSGVVFSVFAAGASVARNHLHEGDDTMGDKKVVQGIETGVQRPSESKPAPGPIEQGSIDGITNFRPRPPTDSSGQGGQNAGGSNADSSASSGGKK